MSCKRKNGQLVPDYELSVFGLWFGTTVGLVGGDDRNRTYRGIKKVIIHKGWNYEG